MPATRRIGGKFTETRQVLIGLFTRRKIWMIAAIALFVVGFLSCLLLVGRTVYVNMALIDAATRGDLQATKRLILSGADVNMRDPDLGVSVFQFAIENGHIDTAHFLLEKGADVNLPDNENRTALMAACDSGFPDEVALLLRANASVNAMDNDHRTALMNAALYGRVACVGLLLSHGANANLKDIHGKTALSEAQQQEGFASGSERQGYLRIIMQLTGVPQRENAQQIK